MKIEKQNTKYWIYYYYRSQTNRKIYHGLYCSEWWGISYHYHGINKGFCLKRLK